MLHDARSLLSGDEPGFVRKLSSVAYPSGLLKDATGLVLNVASDRSLAWHIARQATIHGARCGVGYLPLARMERRVRNALKEGGLDNQWIHPCDVSSDDSIKAFFDAAAGHFGRIDFLVHSLAFAQRQYLQPGKFLATPREAFLQAVDISAYSLLAVARAARPLMPNGGAILTLTYLGSERAVPGYNVMGVAKAALEATVRYLALELGPAGIRVNAISAGPVRTLSAMAVGGIDEMLAHVQAKSPLKRNIDGDDVAKSAIYLLSDLSSGVTGEIIHVDAGYSMVGL